MGENVGQNRKESGRRRGSIWKVRIWKGCSSGLGQLGQCCEPSVPMCKAKVGMSVSKGLYEGWLSNFKYRVWHTEGVSSTECDAQVVVIKVMILELNAGREAPSGRCSHLSSFFPSGNLSDERRKGRRSWVKTLRRICRWWINESLRFGQDVWKQLIQS